MKFRLVSNSTPQKTSLNFLYTVSNTRGDRKKGQIVSRQVSKSAFNHYQPTTLLRVYTMTKKERSGVAKYHASPKESLELHNMGKKERIHAHKARILLGE
jgi:hypothetical protein